ncbi:glycoside hydrolase superfamily [Chlamydoabsidia padenii]|nr:glycoside hydrolase superfamily [Chlamydoabsidia padenii]
MRLYTKRAPRPDGEIIQDEKPVVHPYVASSPVDTWWQNRRTRTVAIVVLTIVAIILIVIVPILIVQQLQHHSSAPDRTPDANKNSTTTIIVDPYDDSARANIHVPALNQDFSYTETPIRGINLGGWLVLEPFITPSVFEQAPDPNKKPEERQTIRDHVALDEWTLCERLGPTKAKQVLEHHYDTFIQESDFKTIRDMGFNHVRIPIGHWSIRPLAHEPFVPHVAWSYLLRGIQWARKYGLRVMVELHTAPGSQNGWNHSGRAGNVGWLNGEHGQEYADETMRVVQAIITFFMTQPKDAVAPQDAAADERKDNNITVHATSGNPWSHVVPMFGVLNEPALMMIEDEPAKQWYRDAQATIRNITGHQNGPILSYHDGFLGLSPWKGFFKDFDRAFLETHMYLIFDPNLVYMEREKQAAVPCESWRSDLAESNKVTAPTMVGLGTRYENTMDGGGVSQCKECNCTKIEDWNAWTPDYKHFLNTFVQHQMDAYESGVGWFFWTYKTEQHVNPHWDYSLAWEKGWAPKDVNQREFSCPKN